MIIKLEITLHHKKYNGSVIVFAERQIAGVSGRTIIFIVWMYYAKNV